MKYAHLFGLAVVGALSFCVVGCADADSANPAPAAAQEGELKGSTLSDDQLKAKLAKLAEGTNFMSETDEPYHVIEGDGTKVKVVTAAVVKKRLAKTIAEQLKGQSPEDINKLNSDKEDFQEWLKGAREGAADPTQDKESREEDRKLAEAMQLMLDQLRGVTAFAFGRDENGDGSVVFVFVGRSKTTGRLIGLTTFGAFT